MKYPTSRGKVDGVLAALAKAQTAADYHAAKRLAERCDIIDQKALVDSFIEAARRVGLR